MSTAARAAASRSAGRGASLGNRSGPTPVTRISQRRKTPTQRPSAGRGTAPSRDSNPLRSSLTASVLQRRDPTRRNQSRPQSFTGAGHGASHENAHYAEATTGRRRGPNSKRKIGDWYTSSARREALAGLAQASSGLEEASKRSSDTVRLTQPFAWADLGEVVGQLPNGHWASGYVSGVASSIDRNDAMDGDQKERVLGEVLQALGRLSREENDERFEDAES